MPRKVQLFTVGPAVPPELVFLETLSRNMWWCWHADAIELFRRIDHRLWDEKGRNPVMFLSALSQERLEELVDDDSFTAHLGQVEERFKEEVVGPDACFEPGKPCPCVAYMSLEYGLHESLRMYSGGLGVLAGDHIKAASDLNIPLVAVGLLYRQGYGQQYLNTDGLQQERYPEHRVDHMPVVRATGPDGKELTVTLPLPEGPLQATVWKLGVGRVPLFLLDTNIPENPPELRTVTAKLYPGDRKTRLRQELLLGIGGIRALAALGCEPRVFHMNEGHAAFVSLARIAHLTRKEGLSREAAREIVARTNVFTTHTPVPAGNETFRLDLVKPHLAALEGELGIDPETVLEWGRASGDEQAEQISMTILALRMAELSNGVSKLHGGVARKMWAHLWPGRPEDEIPIGSVTNGIHVASWLSAENAALFDRYLGPDWRREPDDPELLSRVPHIPDEDLWRAHELGRARMIRRARDLGERQMRVRNVTPARIEQIRSVLDFDALTIVFARRFVPYKRATLLLRDPERFKAILADEKHPVQFVFAGKAHPADNTGKELIRQIVHFAEDAGVRQKIIFLENYDIGLARYLVQGADVWLNTPRRPLEASGTSGMKAAVNGVLNVSVLDGWWDEGYTPDCGWAIGSGEEHADTEYQDTVESQALFNLLENEIIPAFFDRPSGGMSAAWVRMMKAAISVGLGQFTSQRMVSEYKTLFYDRALEEHDSMVSDGASRAEALVAQRKRFESLWPKVRVERIQSDTEISDLHVGDRFAVTAEVFLGELEPGEVDVQVYFGPVDSENRITESHSETMEIAERGGNGTHTYRQEVACKVTGRHGFTVRVEPSGSDWTRAIPGFLTWADGA